ncbi:MAG: signal peptidase II [Acidimicrobiales bacterium]
MDAKAGELNQADPAEPASRVSVKLVAVVVVVGVVLDHLTKLWAVRTLAGRAPIEILPTLELDLHYNNGFSFGTGQGAGALIGIAVIAMSGYLIHLLRKERSPRRGLILAIILSGALGNLIDRVFRADDGPLSGDVIDFIDVSWFAIFNVADIFVVGGVGLFALFELFGPGRSGAGEGGQE